MSQHFQTELPDENKNRNLQTANMSIPNSTKQTWIKMGYEHFAFYGPQNLSINKISKEIGSPRASFYHYFGDIDIFTEELLNMH